jgi:hypothetical protein
MNSKYFALPFALTFGGVVGWLITVALTVWVLHRTPYLKNWIKGS